MTTKIVTGVIDSATLASFGQAGPAIANVQIANSSYSQIDDTAISLSGGYIIINGNNFSSNVQVLIDGTTATSVTYVSNTQLRAEIGSSTSGSKVVYVINNNDGSTAIRVNGITYSEFPTWITDTSLGTEASGAAIAISLSANSDSNVTYSVAAGSSLPTGLSLASNGYLSGTVTVGSLTVYNFTILATDTENQDSSKAFSLTISVGDTNIADVVSLIQMDKTTWLSDASDQKLDLTRQSDTFPNVGVYPTSFSPYRGSYYSVGADDIGDKITTTSSGFAFGTGAFTIEFWAWDVSYANYRCYITTRPNNSGYADAWHIGSSSSGSMTFYSNTNMLASAAAAFPLGEWYHVAVTRDGSSNAKMFINGEIVASGTVTNNFAKEDLGIGNFPTANQEQMYGMISNVRVVKGTALYTAAFTPPTSPLTTTSQGATASEVQLLTCQSNRFIDNSPNGLTLTSNGNIGVSGFAPFAPNTAYQSYGSGYFSGSDDRIDTSGISPDPLNVGTSDYCFEMWMYVEQIINTWIPVYIGGIGRLSFLITDNGTNFQVANYGYSGNVNRTGNLVFKAWNHVAFTRESNTSRIFLNGTQLGTDATESTNWSSSGFVIGANHVGNDNELQGYIADARIVVGSPVYTSNFSVPTEPLSAITNTKLLILQNNYPRESTSIVERSGADIRLEVNGDINTSSFSPYSPFGYSNYFDGTGDYLVVPANNDFLFDDGDFTIEAWIHPNITNTQIGIVNNWQTGGAFQFYVLNNNRLYFMFTSVSSGTTSVNFTSTDTISPDVWTHVALVRSGNSLYFFINGTLDSGGAQTITQTMYYYNGGAKDLKIGTAGDTGSLWRGYISNLRIIKGTGLYTSSFTPSTAALTPTNETVLLTCQSPSFIDNGKRKHLLTRFGDARVTPYTPFKGHTITPDSHSVDFNTSGQHILTPSLAVGSGEFTMEFWLNLTSDTTYGGLLNFAASEVTGKVLYFTSNKFLSFYDGADITPNSGLTQLAKDTWYHVAFVRQSDNYLKIYLNGTLYSTSTTTYTTSISLPLYIGKYGTNNNINGKISNLRIIAGTCLYTSNFTSPTGPLTTTSQGATASEVLLLACQDSTIKDNSNNNFSLTANGAQPVEFNPFGFTTSTGVEYNPLTHAGSMYGDGTTDYVDVPANNINGFWNQLQGDFCIQFWTYSKEVDANKGQIAIGGNKIAIRFDSSNRMTFWVAGNGGPTSTVNNQVYPFNWYHVCLERSGSTNTLYINGVAKATNTTTPSNDATPIIRIGGTYADNTGYTFTGWISDLSIRSKAVYKGNFVPPKQVTYGDQTKLQVPFSDAAIYDAKSQLTYEVNSLKTSSKVTKFNNQSLSFAGVNDYVYTEERHGTVKVYGKQLKLSTNDFTVEFWVNFNSLSGRQDILWVGTSTRLGILYNLNANELTYYAINESAITANPSFSTNTWYHVALSRYNGSTKLFVNGTQLGSTYSDSKDYDESILYIGKDSGGNSSYFNGYLDNIRITKAGRYTSNFTAPTENFSKK